MESWSVCELCTMHGDDTGKRERFMSLLEAVVCMLP